MPAFSQEELDEILGTGYASRVLASQVLCPTARSVPAIPYVQNNELHMPPAGVIADPQVSPLSQPRVIPNIYNSSRSFLEHPESQIDSPGLVSKPGKNHSVHRAVSALNGLPQLSLAQKDLSDRTLNANNRVRAAHSFGLKQVSRTELGRDGKLKANSILRSRTSNRNTKPNKNARNSPANGRNVIEPEQTISRILGPRQPLASPRASHTSRVLAFNQSRNPHADTFNAPNSDRDQHLPITASRSFAVVIRNPPISTGDSQLLALSYDDSSRGINGRRSRGEQLEIFNTMFADDLKACGLRNGISSPSTIESQWRDMKAGKEGYKYWTFFNINFAHWDRTLTDLQERIQKAAVQNEIILKIRLIEESNVRNHGHLQKGAKNAIPSHDLEGPEMVPPAAHCPALPEMSSSLNSQASIEDTEDLAPTEGHDQKKPNIPPKLAYRFFNILSAGCNGRQFICGALTEGAAMPPRDPDSEAFKIAFTRHMEPDPTLASPFISTFASCLPPIHRAMSNRNAACIAVINIAGIIHDSKEASGESQSVFSAGDLVLKYGLSLRGNYTADTEYHVYGTIPSKYVLCIFSADHLWDIAKASPAIDAVLHLPRLESTPPRGLSSLKRWLTSNSASYSRDTGRLVGELLRLLGAPDGIILDLSMKIAEVWRFKGYTRHKEESFCEADREYISAVKLGYKSEQNGKYEDMHAAVLTTQPTAQISDLEIIPSSRETRGTGKALPEDDEVDPFNPYDVDMDGAASDVSQSVHMKVEPWLAGLQDAARETEDDDRMNIDQLDESDGIWGSDRNGDGEREPEQLSPLQRMAAKKGLKFNKPPKWMLGRD